MRCPNCDGHGGYVSGTVTVGEEKEPIFTYCSCCHGCGYLTHDEEQAQKEAAEKASFRQSVADTNRQIMESALKPRPRPKSRRIRHPRRTVVEHERSPIEWRAYLVEGVRPNVRHETNIWKSPRLEYRVPYPNAIACVNRPRLGCGDNLPGKLVRAGFISTSLGTWTRIDRQSREITVRTCRDNNDPSRFFLVVCRSPGMAPPRARKWRR